MCDMLVHVRSRRYSKSTKIAALRDSDFNLEQDPAICGLFADKCIQCVILILTENYQVVYALRVAVKLPNNCSSLTTVYVKFLEFNTVHTDDINLKMSFGYNFWVAKAQRAQ